MFSKLWTRWTFFRVKLVFESDFEISRSLCPWDPWTFGLLDYNVSSGPFLSYEIEIGDGPGPELDNSSSHKQLHLNLFALLCYILHLLILLIVLFIVVLDFLWMVFYPRYGIFKYLVKKSKSLTGKSYTKCFIVLDLQKNIYKTRIMKHKSFTRMRAATS